jgi:peptidoglycan hydrolase-like protein with peptidoglycan-binding domain
MLPLLAGAAALLMLLGSSAKSATTARTKPAPAKPSALPKPVVNTPKSAPLTAMKVKIGPAKITKVGPPKAAAASSLNAPLAKSASQGGGPALAAPLSADIPADVLKVKPAPLRPAPPPRSQSPGYKPDAAKRAAASVSAHLKRTGKAGYDRRLLRQWQTQAGLTADGLYGPATRGALIFYGQKDPPAAFAGSGTVPFTAPR